MALLTRRGFGAGADTGGLGVSDHIGEELNRRKVERGEERGATIRPFSEYGLLIPEPRGPIDLEWFPFQREPLYSDEIAEAEVVAIKKSTQVGISTGEFRWAFWRADVFAETAIYFFPTANHVHDFSDERVEPAIEGSEYLLGRANPVRSKGAKKVGAGIVYFRGVHSKTAVQSVAAQAIVFDEYDESDPGNIAQAERRISGARALGLIPRIRRLGRPTIPGYGIDAEYEGTDQRVWIVACPDCGLKQEVDFFENLRWRTRAAGDEVLRFGEDRFESIHDVVEVWRACRKCETSLESDDPEAGPLFKGLWVPQKKGAGRSPGFFVPRLIVPRTGLADLVEASRKTRPVDVETFFNNDLGLAYASEESQLTLTVLDAACSLGGDALEEYRGRFPVTMGVDVASERNLNVRISEHGPDGRRRAIYIAEVDSFERVGELLEAFNVHMAVVDSMPERRLARALANRFPGRVFICSYESPGQSSGREPDALRVDVEKREIRVNRTEAIDAMYDSIRQKTNLPLHYPPPKYREQMVSMKRRTEENTKGVPIRRYISTGPLGDDYAHAEVYDVVATELLEMIAVAEAQSAGEGEIIPEQVEADQRLTDRGRFGYDPGFGGRSDY